MTNGKNIMGGHSISDSEQESAEVFGILNEIKQSEKKADEILEKAKKEKDSIIHDAGVNSSKAISAKEEEIRKLQEKKIMEFRDKSRLLVEEKIAEGKIGAKQAKAKSEKNAAKAVDFVMKKFEEMI